ncbi:MAG: SUMF1/EgtB/PvdO family nonheme iron enzyme [Bacteroidota bacterium]
MKCIFSKLLFSIQHKRKVVIALVSFLTCFGSFANNIAISNLSLTGKNTTDHYTLVQFDISWDNSFRISSESANWDAAWIFVKYRYAGGVWQHAFLNNAGHLAPLGSTIYPGIFNPSATFNPTTNPGLGAFIYRDSDGTGTFSKTGVQLRWNYGVNGVGDNDEVEIQVFAIEMVYVPQGAFTIGSGGSEAAAFYKYPSSTTPYIINSEAAIPVGAAQDYLYYEHTTYSSDQLGPIPALYPKGYNAFYCMKYEISQQGYVDFLNNITTTQATNRFSVQSSYRNGINVSGNVYYTTYPYVACNFLGWPDITAYYDWSGLRPMTELEFEKACRGPISPVANEYVWGTTGIASNPYTLNNIGSSSEVIGSNYNVSTSIGNAAHSLSTPRNGAINGPVRVGIFAGTAGNNSRITAGATYYGIMEMGGNLWERPVSLGNPTGRAFDGTHGDGSLNSTGFSNVSTWPGSDAVGSGFRGGHWGDYAVFLRTSDRNYAAYVEPGRFFYVGGRGVRIAP